MADAAEIVALTPAEGRDVGISFARVELDADLFDELEGKLEVPLRLASACSAVFGSIGRSSTAQQTGLQSVPYLFHLRAGC